jgi:hypothetical protein
VAPDARVQAVILSRGDDEGPSPVAPDASVRAGRSFAVYAAQDDSGGGGASLAAPQGSVDFASNDTRIPIPNLSFHRHRRLVPLIGF